jgi:hypothetical protein
MPPTVAPSRPIPALVMVDARPCCQYTQNWPILVLSSGHVQLSIGREDKGLSETHTAAEQKEWLTIQEAGKVLGKSGRTIRRFVSLNLIKTKMDKQAGHAVVLYHAGDIERLQHEGIPLYYSGEGTGGELTANGAGKGGAFGGFALHLLQAAVESGRQQAEDDFDLKTPWVSFETACEISGLRPHLFREAVRSGQIRTLGHRNRVYLREDVLAYRGEPVSAQ